MSTEQQVEVPKTSGINLPPALRKSHWAARMKDLIEKAGSLKGLCIECATLTDGDVVLLQNRVQSVTQKKSSIESAATLVMSMEKLVSKTQKK